MCKLKDVANITAQKVSVKEYIIFVPEGLIWKK